MEASPQPHSFVVACAPLRSPPGGAFNNNGGRQINKGEWQNAEFSSGGGMAKA